MGPKSKNGDRDHPRYVKSPVVIRRRARPNVPAFAQFQNGKDTVKNPFPIRPVVLTNQEGKLSVTSNQPTPISVDVVNGAVNVDSHRMPRTHVPAPPSQYEPASKMAKVENEHMISYAYRDSEVSSSNDNFNQPPGSRLQWPPNRTVTVRKAERVSCSSSSVGGSLIINHVMTSKPAVSHEDRNFQPNIIRKHLQPVWDCLFQSNMSIPFREPVDPVVLNIPDYFDIVTEPMDLSTIANKLHREAYANPWEFCDDIWLMFKNAWLYNRKPSKVHRLATKLSDLFMEKMDPVMRKMGYCCSGNLSFTPPAIFCYGQFTCTIARDQSYMIHKPSPPQFGISESDYIYCLRCFEDLPSSNPIPKEKFVNMKNDVIHDESFEKCKSCHKKWHRICALFDKNMIPGGFLCDSCRSRKCYPRPSNTSTAKMLPHNKLSMFLETRVNNFISSQPSWRSTEKNEVIIRTLLVEDKNLEVKPLMKERFSPQGFPERFAYRKKAVFAFEVIDGMEVCFFGMHVQEYGSNVPNPNQRRVYISYLDSVQYFQPKELRTEVYYEILLGYLDYVRGLGYSMAHVWSCPPGKSDDYIFHCHPPEQKVPRPKRLQEWYKTMIEKGIRECFISEFKDIYQQARDDGLMSPVQLPYFDGDYWPNVIEDCIRKTNEEDLKRKRLEDKNDGEQLVHYSQQDKKRNRMKGSKKNALAHKNTHTSVTGDPLTDRLYSMLEKQRNVFFTIRLVSQPISETHEIFDPDPVMPCNLMGRETFLARAREEHWEFSSLRRAKYSTMVFCHALHDPEKRIALSCKKCSAKALSHCTVCENFDLCDTCYRVENHPHKMDNIQSSLKRRKNEEFVASIIHACQCHDATCKEWSCRKMKKVVQHTKSCRKDLHSNCSMCKQLVALCFYHCKGCTTDRCPVPFCVTLRERFLEQQRSAVYRTDMMMRRRMGALGTDDNRLM